MDVIKARFKLSLNHQLYHTICELMNIFRFENNNRLHHDKLVGYLLTKRSINLSAPG